jgi:hypothetical protein
MSQGKNKQALELQFMLNIPNMFKNATRAANLLKAGGTGTEKKQLAMSIFTDLISTAAPAAATNNPKWAEVIGAVSDSYVAAQNISGTMPEIATPALGGTPAHD